MKMKTKHNHPAPTYDTLADVLCQLDKAARLRTGELRTIVIGKGNFDVAEYLETIEDLKFHAYRMGTYKGENATRDGIWDKDLAAKTEDVLIFLECKKMLTEKELGGYPVWFPNRDEYMADTFPD